MFHVIQSFSKKFSRIVFPDASNLSKGQDRMNYIMQLRAGKVRICHQFLRMGWSDEVAAFPSA